MTVRWAPAEWIMAGWRPGSYDTHADYYEANPDSGPCRYGDYEPSKMPWTWEDEAVDIDRHGELVPVVFSARLVGIFTPVLLGDDGRVWGGHHRILGAARAGELVPFETADDAGFVDSDGNWAHG